MPSTRPTTKYSMPYDHRLSRSCGAVTILGYVRVHVPGAGTETLWDAMLKGGPSLLVQTVAQITGIPINHYARLDFTHITGLV